MNAVVQTEEKMTNLEWLGHQLRAKTANYEADTKATGGIPANWEDRCGAIATLPTPEAKAYASILVWGDYRDNSEQFITVVNYIAEYLKRMVEEEVEKQRETFNMTNFCKHVARMELFYSLRPFLKECHTLKGRLVFSGINYIEPNTYSKRYAWLGNAVEILLKELENEIDDHVGDYRRQMRKVG